MSADHQFLHLQPGTGLKFYQVDALWQGANILFKFFGIAETEQHELFPVYVINTGHYLPGNLPVHLQDDLVVCRVREKFEQGLR